MKENEIKTLSPKLDVVFQALFGEVGNEKITKGFLETILKRKIETIDLSKNLVLRRDFKDDKLGVLDILAELDGKEKCNIELQIIDRKNIIERILFYWSKLYSRGLKAGQDYRELEKTIIILITNFEIEGLNELSYHSKWQIMETESSKKIILTEKLEIDIIELPKIIGKETNQDKLLDWLYFLEEPKGERVTKKMEENEELKEAVEKLCTLSEDEKMQRIADLREKAILDEKAIYARGEEVKQREIAKRLIELNINIKDIMKATNLTMEEIEKIYSKEEIKKIQKIADLREKAILDEKAIYAKGIDVGIEKGEKQKQIEIARKMLEDGLDIQIVAKYTALTIEEIEKLTKNQ